MMYYLKKNMNITSAHPTGFPQNEHTHVTSIYIQKQNPLMPRRPLHVTQKIECIYLT